MYLLSVDTSTEICSVAVGNMQGELLAVEDLLEPNSHSSKLAPMIADILAGLGLSAEDLSAISFSNGPGSYTGLRVGLSTVKAMSFALEIPLIAINTLDIIADYHSKQADNYDYIIPMIDARRDEVYCAVYSSTAKCILPSCAIILDGDSFRDLIDSDARVALAGNGATKAMQLIDLDGRFLIDENLSARFQLSLAARQYNEERFVDSDFFAPYYLKSPNITKPKKLL